MGYSSYYSQGSLHGCRVLIAEHDQSLAGELADAVARTGACVNGLHCSALEALAAIRTGGVDFAVLDINLHGWGAFRIAEALKSRRTPFVFATGYDLTVIPEQWYDIGLWQKPFDAADLISALAHKSEIGRSNLQPVHPPQSGVTKSTLLSATEARITHRKDLGQVWPDTLAAGGSSSPFLAFVAQQAGGR